MSSLLVIVRSPLLRSKINYIPPRSSSLFFARKKSIKNKILSLTRKGRFAFHFIVARYILIFAKKALLIFFLSFFKWREKVSSHEEEERIIGTL